MCFANNKAKRYTDCEARILLKRNKLCVCYSDHKGFHHKSPDVRVLFFSTEKVVALPFQNTFFVSKSSQNSTNSHVSANQKHLCSSGEYVSAHLLHDGIPHSGSGSDEKNWSWYKNQKQINSTFCKQGCVAPVCYCAHLHFQTIKGGCRPLAKNRTHFVLDKILFKNFADQSKATNTANNNNIKTGSMENNYFDHFETTKFESLHSDCSQREFLLFQHRQNHSAQPCKEMNQIPCTYGCSRCFPFHKLCVYETDHDGKVMHCPSGAHLKNCQAMDCNNMFKCPTVYCVPYR